MPMTLSFPYDLLEDPKALAKGNLWSEDVYRDLFSLQKGSMSEEIFKKKYLTTKAILVLDMTGFTESAHIHGEIRSFLRIVNVQKICAPVLKEYKAELIRFFADDIVALFGAPNDAVNAAFDIHKRIHAFNKSEMAGEHTAECCIGIGYGDVYAIGPNLAMGNEMNKASKLGEDTAKASETLVTEGLKNSLKNRSDITFQKRSSDDLKFPFFAIFPS